MLYLSHQTVSNWLNYNKWLDTVFWTIFEIEINEHTCGTLQKTLPLKVSDYLPLLAFLDFECELIQKKKVLTCEKWKRRRHSVYAKNRITWPIMEAKADLRSISFSFSGTSIFERFLIFLNSKIHCAGI